MKIKKVLEKIAGDFINLHDTLRAIAIAEEVTYQQAAFFLYQSINDPANSQSIPLWKLDPMSVPEAEMNEDYVKRCFLSLRQAAKYGEPTFCDEDGFSGEYLYEDLFPGMESLGFNQYIGFNKADVEAFLLTQEVDISLVVLNDDIPNTPVTHESKGNGAHDSLVKILSDCQQENARLIFENKEVQDLQRKVSTLEGAIHDLRLELEDRNKELVLIDIKYTAIQNDIAGGKTKSTLLKIIAGFALCGRRIDIRQERLKGVSDLLRDFETNGVRVDQKTLSEYLKESSEYFN